MAVDLSEVLVIGVSTRALFNLEDENKVFEEEGIEAFRKYQLQNEDELLQPGTAFHLVKNLLALNTIAKNKIVEVVVMSRNSPETGMRVLNTIDQYDLDITRVAFTGGEPLLFTDFIRDLAQKVKQFNVPLFLETNGRRFL